MADAHWWTRFASLGFCVSLFRSAPVCIASKCICICISICLASQPIASLLASNEMHRAAGIGKLLTVWRLPCWYSQSKKRVTARGGGTVRGRSGGSRKLCRLPSLCIWWPFSIYWRCHCRKTNVGEVRPCGGICMCGTCVSHTLKNNNVNSNHNSESNLN